MAASPKEVVEAFVEELEEFKKNVEAKLTLVPKELLEDLQSMKDATARDIRSGKYGSFSFGDVSVPPEMRQQVVSMLKVLVFLRLERMPNEQERRRWWLEHHAPLVARLPGLRRYAVNLAVGEAPLAAPYHGVAELWFDDEAAYRASMRAPEGLAVVADYQAIGGEVRLLFTEEHSIRSP